MSHKKLTIIININNNNKYFTGSMTFVYNGNGFIFILFHIKNSTFFCTPLIYLLGYKHPPF